MKGKLRRIYEDAIDGHHAALKSLMADLHDLKKITTPNQLAKFQRRISKENEKESRIITL